MDKGKGWNKSEEMKATQYNTIQYLIQGIEN